MPFEARVARDTLARSGNGERFYVTNRLKEGDRVVVERVDPSGWGGIQPPPGSFSWIRSQYVQRQGNRGTVTEDNVVVRVGSEFGDDHQVEQVRLSRGDVVEILGEQVLVSDGRRIPMLKIRPPKGELRWVPARDIVPLRPADRIKAADASAFDAASAAAPRPEGAPTQTDTDPFAFGAPTTGSLTPGNAIRSDDVGSLRPAPSPGAPAFRPPPAATPQPGAPVGKPGLDEAATHLGPPRSFAQPNTVETTIRTRPVHREPPRRDPFAESPIDPFTAEGSGTAGPPADDQGAVSPRHRAAAGAPPSTPASSRSASSASSWNDAGASRTPSRRTDHAPPDERNEASSVSGPGPADGSNDGVAPEASPGTLASEWLDELQAIDGDLNGMLRRPKSEWSGFDAFERRYRTLQAAVPHQSVKRLIELRLRLLEHYRRQKRQFDAALDEFRRIVEETDRRNAELARRRRAATAPQAPPDKPAPSTPPLANPRRGTVDTPDHSASAVTTVVKPPLRPRTRRPAASGLQFDGAGILQRSATRYPGAPRYVLLAPDGRILTYLRPDPRINLERYVGRAVGVFGPRRFAPELQADLLDVKGVMPVRLRLD
ncbi:MAG: hypothetical protein D6725_15540 [Planctomycetota bacterium]|nr:MAG: hypothetical protein D6725_15540 [Planctomycetota bacterium]